MPTMIQMDLPLMKRTYRKQETKSNISYLNKYTLRVFLRNIYTLNCKKLSLSCITFHNS